MKSSILVAISACFLATACTSVPIMQANDAAIESPGLPVSAQSDFLPSPAALDQLKTPAFTSSILINGANPQSKSVNTTVLGTTLQLQPAAGAVSYAVYGINTNGYEVSRVAADVNMSAPESVWLAFANYDSNRWTIVNAQGANLTDLALPAGSLRSPGSNFFIALISYDNAPTTITSITIETPQIEWLTHEITSAESGYNLRQLDTAALIGDKLYLLYSESKFPDNRLKLARCNTTEPQASAHWSSSIVDSGGMKHDTWDIADVDGRPAVSWFYYDNKAQWYARSDSLTPTGPGDWIFNNLETISHIELQSLAEIDGRPAVIYGVQVLPATTTIRFSHAVKPRPDSLLDWVTTDCFTSENNFVNSLYLDSVSGKPAVVLMENGTQNFYYISSATVDPGGLSDWQICLVDNYNPHVNGNLPGIRFMVNGGKPAVMYQSSVLGLWYAQADRERPFLQEHWTAHQVSNRVFNHQSLAQTTEGLLGCYIDSQAGQYVAVLSNLPQPAYRRDWRSSEVFAGNGLNLGYAPFSIATAGGTPLLIYLDVVQQKIMCARYDGM